MMRKLRLLARHWLLALLYPRPIVGLLYLPRFISHWRRYASTAHGQPMPFSDMQPCLGDWSTHTPFDAHYFYQGAWLSRMLAESKPARHIDIGSSVLTMSVLSATVDTIFVDYRPLKANLPGLDSVAGNILHLPFPSESAESLSCLHVIEHIGLGRYGDPIDPMGSVKAAIELQRILKPGGKLYLSLPVGRERVCFNAHRVHSPNSVLDMFSGLKLLSFSVVDDQGFFTENSMMSSAEKLEYGCGMFVFEREIA